ncbi:hypothetical protein TorRG33x02_069980 [Trema orientale]|uniref:Uncharacterized protein n=1 Tax=Trema orientale TaxID=63057 RepID=A0A2P5FHK6_TREOI|nr:hypothetical protein TorRG33x02_069980 [Trema orientale]
MEFGSTNSIDVRRHWGRPELEKSATPEAGRASGGEVKQAMCKEVRATASGDGSDIYVISGVVVGESPEKGGGMISFLGVKESTTKGAAEESPLDASPFHYVLD